MGLANIQGGSVSFERIDHNPVFLRVLETDPGVYIERMFIWMFGTVVILASVVFTKDCQSGCVKLQLSFIRLQLQ